MYYQETIVRVIDLKRKEDCCGCGACFDACTKEAIVWNTDDEGFSYPQVDASRCVNCGLCNKVCPIENSVFINQYNEGFLPKVIGAYHKNEDIRFTSTSGGAFWGLAEEWVRNGGYVAGAVFYNHFNVKHIVTNKIEELKRIKGSKYCQSDARDTYRTIAKLLKNGERVLATGLPCHMAALRQYLRNEYDNLLIVDIICQSVPSPLLFEKYIDYLENKYNSKVVVYHPKNKEMGGWHHFSFKAYFENGQIYHQCNDLYTSIAFSNGYIMSRHSCYECHFKHMPQPSDLTIGDFWGIDKIDNAFDSPKGVSKIMVNNQKGLNYLKSLNCFEEREYDLQSSVYENKKAESQIVSIEHCDESKRRKFVQNLKEKNFLYAVLSHTLPEKTIKQKILKTIKLIWAKYN